MIQRTSMVGWVMWGESVGVLGGLGKSRGKRRGLEDRREIRERGEGVGILSKRTTARRILVGAAAAAGAMSWRSGWRPGHIRATAAVHRSRGIARCAPSGHGEAAAGGGGVGLKR